MSKRKTFDRRAFLGTTAAGLGLAASPMLAQTSETIPDDGRLNAGVTVQRNTSVFRALDWQPYFSNTRGGAILVDTQSRALHYWSENQSVYKLYPTSVPLSEELTRRGRTEVVRKVEGPSWASDAVNEAAQPRMARFHRSWPGKSAGDPCALPELDLLSDPRHP